MASYVQDISSLTTQVDRLWNAPEVGPPDMTAAPALSELLGVYSGLHVLWWREEGSPLSPQATTLLRSAVNKELESSPVGGSALTLWGSLLSVVSRDTHLPVGADERLLDDMVAVTDELLNATQAGLRGTSSDLSKVDLAGVGQAREDVRALRRRLRQIYDSEILRRVAQKARSASATVEEAAETSQAVLETQREAVGETGSLSLATHFSALARAESTRADWFLGAAIAIFLAFIVIVAFFVPHTGVSVTELISRAVIAIPGFGLAAYLAREGGRHRHVAQWARSLEVQLKIVDAFGAPMTTADVSEVRKVFAVRAFGAMPALPGRQSGTDSPAPVDLQAIIERLIAELRSKG